MSQPWQDASWAPSPPAPDWAEADPAGPAEDAAADATGLTGTDSRDAGGGAGHGAAADPAQGQHPGRRRGPLLTGRGAIAGMLVVFFIGVLAASWLHWSLLAAGSFVAGSAAAAWYTKRRDLLTVAVSPPLLFFVVVICVKALTAAGNTLLSTVEGTALTLANMAPWLFIGVVLSLAIAWFRGLPHCVAALRRDLRPDLARRRPGGTGAPGSPRCPESPESPESPASVGGYRPAVKRYR